MTLENLIKGKTILVTGGTGSFGNAVVKRLLTLDVKKIIIYSRDEKKQFDMGNEYNNDKLKFVIGDVREKDSLYHATYGVDYIFHAAALKQVPNCEFFPLEAIKTNSLGAHNVIDAAIYNEIERAVVLSTDKAVHPINVMGITKALMERIMIAAARENRNHTSFCGTRYGNVMYTRGSVIPYFINLIKLGKPLRITHKKMTRFMMTLEESVDLVLYALTQGEGGDIYVKKAPATTVETLVEALISLFDYKGGMEEVGIRPGEKMHETLVSMDELHRVEDKGEYYRIKMESPGADYRDYFFKGIKNHNIPDEGYTSANTKRLNLEETKELLLKIPELRDELERYKAKH